MTGLYHGCIGAEGMQHASRALQRRTPLRIDRGIVLALVCLMLFWSSAASAKVYIDIDAPAFQQFPIAIQEFKLLDGADDEAANAVWFAEELGRAMSLTGFFRVIDRAAFLEDAAAAGITAPQIRFGDWLSIGADFLVKGGLGLDGPQLSSEFRLFDVVRGELITGKKYSGRPEDRKIMVMKFAEEILLALTGQRGVFNTKIAFVGKKNGQSEIFSVGFDGSEIEKVSDYDSLTLLPRWSPDGRMLSFVSYISGNSDSYILNLESKQRTVLTNFSGLNMPSDWSSDGKKILTVLSKDGNSDIYVIDMKDKTTQRLTNSPSIDVSPSWSPDNSKIVFVSNRSGSPHLFVMDSDGGNVRRITFQGSYNTSPRWSPTGDRIVFVGVVEGRFQLFTVDHDGNNMTRLTFGSWDSLGPDWSPDGRYIVYTMRRGSKENVCIINSNGLNFRVIKSVEGVDSIKNPSWSPFLDLY